MFDLESLWKLLDELADAGWPADLLANFADEIEELGERRRAAIMRRAEELAGLIRDREARLKRERDENFWWLIAFLLLFLADEPKPAPTATINERRTAS